MFNTFNNYKILFLKGVVNNLEGLGGPSEVKETDGEKIDPILEQLDKDIKNLTVSTKNKLKEFRESSNEALKEAEHEAAKEAQKEEAKETMKEAAREAEKEMAIEEKGPTTNPGNTGGTPSGPTTNPGETTYNLEDITDDYIK